jgi:single-stranded-DNA-specific exonuclease
MILSSAAPPREDLAALYRVLRDIASDAGGAIETTNAELATRVKGARPLSTLNEKGVSTGIGVFRELGLAMSEGAGSYRRLTLVQAPEAKLDLMSSVRYAEGSEEIEDFEAFAARVLEAPADELLHAFNRPILPTRPQGVDALLSGGDPCR